jgi:hypothetical protein
MQRLLPLIIFSGIAFFAWNEFGLSKLVVGAGSGSDQILTAAFQNRTSDLQVEGRGEVIRLLEDDNKGSRHQRFILRLETGQTILVAHNIDLAPRIVSLDEGDLVSFYGEYEWNSKGGVIHWTHDDPDHRHVAGWLKHQGRTYQ